MESQNPNRHDKLIGELTSGIPSFPLTQEELAELDQYKDPAQRALCEAMIRLQVSLDEAVMEEDLEKELAERAQILRELREAAGEPEPQDPQE